MSIIVSLFKNTMNHLKKHLPLKFIIVAAILLSACTSNDNDEDTIEESATNEMLSITSFKLSSNEHSFTTIKATIQPIDSLVVCLFASPVDYSDLIPEITYQGTSIEYSINNGSFNTYSLNSSESIDFSYPNTVDFKITNSDDSNSKIYRIIVDTEQPILFNNPEITIPDSPVNTNYNGIEIDTWTNVGNYPIRLTLRTTEYVAITSPKTDASNIFSATLTKASDIQNPNETGEVNVFTTNASITGSYATTALFNLNFNENLGYIVYDDETTNEYVKNIGYKKAELKLKGNIID